MHRSKFTLIAHLVTLLATLGLGTAGHAEDVVIIGGTTGNGDFNAGGSRGAQTYAQTANWFNAQGPESLNFTNPDQMSGSTDPDNDTTSRGGMPFRDRVQINDTGHTITAAGEVFRLGYDFGAGGQPARWTGVETMRTFLFTSSTAVDGDTGEGDITELDGSENHYAIDRGNDGQWSSHSVPVFYTATAADIGKTIYLGMEFLDGDHTDGDLYPRIDDVRLEVVVPEP